MVQLMISLHMESWKKSQKIGLDDSVSSWSLKHPPTHTHTKTWKANQVASVFQSSPFPPPNMSQSCLQSPPSVSSNISSLSCWVSSFAFAETTEQKPLCLQLKSCHHNVRPYVMVTGRTHSPQKHRCHSTTICLHNQPYFSSWLFLKALWLHHDQGLPLSWLRVGCDFEMTWRQVVTKLPKSCSWLAEDISWTWEQVHHQSGQTCAWLTNNT